MKRLKKKYKPEDKLSMINLITRLSRITLKDNDYTSLFFYRLTGGDIVLLKT